MDPECDKQTDPLAEKGVITVGDDGHSGRQLGPYVDTMVTVSNEHYNALYAVFTLTKNILNEISELGDNNFQKLSGAINDCQNIIDADKEKWSRK